VVREDARVEQNTSLVLDGSNCTDNVGIVSYRWTIEGPAGTTDVEGMMVIHRFTGPGWYNVTLLVTDAAGNGDEALFFVEVTPPEGPDGNGGGGGPSEGYGIYVLIAIVAVVLVAVVVVYLWRTR
jgi:hypothetical protein